MKEERLVKVLGIIGFISLLLPFAMLKSHHNCNYDKCLRIFAEGNLGVCVKKAINDLCLAVSILWFIAVMGGSMILEKCKNSVSPFVFMVSLIALATFAAFMDPSKWTFAISLLPSFAIIIILCVIDKRNKEDKQKV